MSKYITTAAWLAENITSDNLVVVDCRFRLDDTAAGDRAYAEGHLPGAVRLDLDRDLSGAKGQHGGRHPLPDPQQFADRLSSLGIQNSTTVVAYDDQGGAMASRLWWLLAYSGHTGDASILDGGYSGWVNAGHPITTAISAPQAAAFQLQLRPDLLADVEEVRSKRDSSAVALLDSREAPRYRGEVEPIDPVAGHIPGALNRFWGEGRHADGRWKSVDEQAERFADLSKYDEIIVYCGSGVTATPNVLALQAAGHTNIKLYAGSWSDWISYDENPVAVGDEEKA